MGKSFKILQGYWSNYLRTDIFLVFFGVIGYRLERFQLICHICFINILQMILIINIGLKQGLIIKLSYYVKLKKIKNTREVGIRSIKVFFIVSLAIVFLMLMYVQEIDNFFVSTVPSKEIFKQKYWLLIITIIVDSLNFSLSTMVQVFNKHYPLLSIFFMIQSTKLFYIFSRLSSHTISVIDQMGNCRDCGMAGYCVVR